MRVIDADELVRDIDELSKDAGFYRPIYEGFKNCINSKQTIDAVPVVRCCECEHWKPTGSKAGNSFSDMEYIGGCEFTNYCRRESDFCSYGEKRRGENGTT